MPALRFPEGIIGRFDELNARYFSGALWHPVFALSDQGPGKYSWYSRRAGVAFIALTPEGLELSSEQIEDTLLHEMVHHAVSTLEEGADATAHDAAFVRLANAIGARMGLAPVAAQSEEAGSWPSSARVSGHLRATG